MDKAGPVTKIRRLTIRPHLRSGKATGRWQIDIPSDISATGKRARKMARSYDEALALAKSLQTTRPIARSHAQSVFTHGQTLDEILAPWFEKQQIRIDLGKKKKSSVEKDLTYLKALQKFFGKNPIDGITEDSLEGYQRFRKAQSIKPITINSEVRTLKAVLNFCVKKKWLSQCPTVEPLRIPKRYEPLPTKEEVRTVLDELPIHHRLLCQIMMETGCRPSEAYNIKWNAVNLKESPQIHLFAEGDWYTVDEWSPKGEETARTIQISDELAAKLDQLPRVSEWMFPSPRGNKPMGRLRKALASARRRAEIKLGVGSIKLTPKIFRKCFVTWQQELGVNHSLIQHQAGHALGSRVTAQHYTRFTESAQRDAIYSLPEAASPEQNNPIVAKKVATQGQNLSYTLKMGSVKML